MSIKKCKRCAKEFHCLHEQNGRLYCSKYCKDNNRAITCRYCGDKFITTHGRRYCSDECKRKSNIKRIKDKNHKDRVLSTESLLLTPYKEPLTRVDHGYGYYGAIAMDKDTSKIQCHICGELHDRLDAHITSHNITVNQYKERYKLAGQTKLISERARMNLIKSYRKNAMFLAKQGKISAASKEKARKRTIEMNKARKGKKESLESKNLKGSCPDQLKAKILDLQKELGKVPSVRDFKAKYGSTFTWNIYATFGSWVNVMRELGLKSIKQKQGEEWSDESLLNKLRAFYERYGRTPSSSDMDNNEMLAAASTYIRRFGTLNKARAKAGVPILERYMSGKGYAYRESSLQNEIESDYKQMFNIK